MSKLKKIALAYGRAERGSAEEQDLLFALRTEVRRQQAVLARLGKTDMGPESRLRTLIDASKEDYEMTADEKKEMRALKRRIGTPKPKVRR